MNDEQIRQKIAGAAECFDSAVSEARGRCRAEHLPGWLRLDERAARSLDAALCHVADDVTRRVAVGDCRGAFLAVREMRGWLAESVELTRVPLRDALQRLAASNGPLEALGGLLWAEAVKSPADGQVLVEDELAPAIVLPLPWTLRGEQTGHYMVGGRVWFVECGVPGRAWTVQSTDPHGRLGGRGEVSLRDGGEVRVDHRCLGVDEEEFRREARLWLRAIGLLPPCAAPAPARDWW
jgi:hypothetical protein